MNQNNCRYVMDVDDNHIMVNDHTILKRDNAVSSQLTFQLLNPDRANRIIFNNPQKLTADIILKKLQNREPVADTSYIRFFFPSGEAEGDFIDKARGDKIRFETESDDWSVASGDVGDTFISFISTCYNQKIIQTLFSVYFKCQNIQSYTPVGLTYAYAEIKNVVGIVDVIKVFPIQKKPAVPQIKLFQSSITTIGGSGKTQLNWQVSGAKEGHLTPGEIDIFTLPSVEVDLNRNVEYRLSLKGNELEKDAFINLYIQPPNVLQLDYDAAAKSLTWRTQYSVTRQLTVGTENSSINENGTMQIQMPAKPQVVLRANGSIYSQFSALNLQGVNLDNPQLFRSCIRVYAHYIHAKWTWSTQDTKSVSFRFTEDGTVWHNASTATSGEFEFLLEKSTLLRAELITTKMDGSTYPVLLLDWEVMS